MEGVDRTSSTYQLKKSLLQKAWRGANPEKAAEIIAKILQIRRWRNTPPEQDEAFLKTIEQARDEILDKKLGRRIENPEERRETIQLIKDSVGPLREELKKRVESGQHPPPLRDDPELEIYFQLELDDELEFRRYLVEEAGYPEDGLPEINPHILRLNGLERLRVAKGLQEIPFRWAQEDAGAYEELRQAYFRRKNAPPPPPTLH